MKISTYTVVCVLPDMLLSIFLACCCLQEKSEEAKVVAKATDRNAVSQLVVHDRVTRIKS